MASSSPSLVKDVVPQIDVSLYGAVGDGSDETVKLQAAIDAASALVSAGSSIDIEAFVICGIGKTYRAVGLIVPKAVKLILNGSKIRPPVGSTGTVIQCQGTRSGVYDGVVWGDTTVSNNMGIHLSSISSGSRQEVKHVNFDNLGGRAILCEAVASRIEDVVAQGCLGADSALGVPTGVLEINTTDCWVKNCEFTASQAALSASGNAYAVVLKGGTHMLDHVVGEISDHGFYIDGLRHSLVGCRADLNFGHGFVFAGASGGRLTGCLSLRNSRQTTATYDGYNFALNSRWRVVASTAECLAAEPQHRYGFEDAGNSYSTYNQFDSTCFSTLHATAAIHTLDFGGAKVKCADGPFVRAADGATTVDLQQYGWPSNNWRLMSTSAVNLTDFTNHVPGQRISVRGDGFTTFVHNTAVMRLLSGANTLAAANTIYEFIVDEGGVWIQI